MTKTQQPIPSLEFHITEKCNYRCEYCIEGKGENKNKKYYHASDKVIDSFIELVKNLDGDWWIQLIGGEPLVHPRFFEVLEETINAGHTVSFITNFSYPIETLKQIADKAEGKIRHLVASVHLSQIKNLNEFTDKVIEFNEYKSNKEFFKVTSVMTEENFEVLKDLKSILDEKKVNFTFQHLKENGNYVKYNADIEEYLATKAERISSFDKIKGKNFYGTLCSTGHKFFNIKIDGSVRRCYHFQKCLNRLGNITDGTFKPFDKPMPCLSDKCTCTTPSNRNMIHFGQNNIFKAIYLDNLYKLHRCSAQLISEKTGVSKRIFDGC